MAITRTYSKARAEFASLCDMVARDRETVRITRRNAEDVALISLAELESLLETVHLLRSPKNASRLIAAYERALEEKGDAMSPEQLRQELKLTEK